MKRKVTLFIAAAALSGTVLVSAVLGDTSSASSQQPSKAALVGLGTTTLGKALVDNRGRTLYLFAKDKAGRSACNGACAAYWPPLVSSAKPRAATGVRLPARSEQANGRQATGDVRGPPALHVQPRQEGGRDERSRPDRLRRELECRRGKRPRGQVDRFLRQFRRERRRLRRLQPRPLSVDPGRGILAPPGFNRPSVNPHANRRPDHPPSRFGGNQPREGRSTDPMTPRQIIRRVRAFPALAAATAVLFGSLAATASGGPTAPAHKSATPPVNVTVFSPREGDIAGRESRASLSTSPSATQASRRAGPTSS